MWSYAFNVTSNQKEHISHQCSFIMILCIKSYLVHVFVLIPYIFYISKGVGGILEESQSEAWIIISFKQELVCPR